MTRSSDVDKGRRPASAAGSENASALSEPSQLRLVDILLGVPCTDVINTSEELAIRYVRSPELAIEFGPASSRFGVGLRLLGTEESPFSAQIVSQLQYLPVIPVGLRTASN